VWLWWLGHRRRRTRGGIGIPGAVCGYRPDIGRWRHTDLLALRTRLQHSVAANGNALGRAFLEFFKALLSPETSALGGCKRSDQAEKDRIDKKESRAAHHADVEINRAQGAEHRAQGKETQATEILRNVLRHSTHHRRLKLRSAP